MRGLVSKAEGGLVSRAEGGLVSRTEGSCVPSLRGLVCGLISRTEGLACFGSYWFARARKTSVLLT